MILVLATFLLIDPFTIIPILLVTVLSVYGSFMFVVYAVVNVIKHYKLYFVQVLILGTISIMDEPGAIKDENPLA